MAGTAFPRTWVRNSPRPGNDKQAGNAAFVLGLLVVTQGSVAHGGPVVALLGAMNKPVLALACMAAGAVVTALVAVSLKKMRQGKTQQTAVA